MNPQTSDETQPMEPNQPSKPTYAQVAASPPRTPIRNAVTPGPRTGSNRTASLRVMQKEADGQCQTPSPPRQQEAEQDKQDSPPDAWGSVYGRGSSLCSEARRERRQEEMDEIRHYGYPTLEDWKNLSVHGNDSMTSEMVRDCLGETLANFGGDIEKHVTDGVDRHGDRLPEYDQIQEEERSRKRQRTEGTLTGEPKKISIRFRKYRPLPSGAARPVDTFSKVEEWRKTARQPQAQSPEQTQTAMAERPRREEKKNGEEAIRNRESQVANNNESKDDNTRHGPAANDPRPPSPHLRDEDYADTPTGEGERSIEWMDIDAGSAEDMPDPAPLSTNTPPQVSALTGQEQQRVDERRAKTRAGLRDVEVLPMVVAPKPPQQERTAPRKATPIPTPGRNRGTLAASPPLTLPAVAEEEGHALTPTPTGGFPEMHHARPESLTEDLAQRRIGDLWKHDQDRVVLFHVANIGYPSPGQRSLISVEVAGLVRAFTGETDFVVVAPEPEWVEPPARRKAPRTWAILGLSPAAARAAIAKRVLSSIWVTIIAYERRLIIPRYLFTLTGFTNNYNDNIRTAVLEAFASDPIYSSILELVQTHPGLSDLDPDEATTEVLSTLQVRVDKLNNGNLQAAVFCDPPTTSGTQWLTWRHRLMAFPFESSYNPTATARPLELCSCCHGADHVTHLCKLPGIPGWNAPPPETRTFGRMRRPLPEQTAMTAMTTGQTMRGRGRGWAPGRGGRPAMQEQDRARMYHTIQR